MSNVNFVNTGRFTAGDRNTVVQAFNAVTPTLTDKIHIYMDGSRARFDERELLYLNQALIESYTTPSASPGDLISSFPNSQFNPAAILGGIGYDASNDTFWVSDNAPVKRIYNLNIDGTLRGMPIALASIDVAITNVRDIAVDPNGTLWFVSGNTAKIYNITKAGIFIDSFDSTDIDVAATSPSGVSVKSDNTLWVSSTGADIIYNATKLGVKISEFPTSAYDGSSAFPGNLDTDPDGSIWICDFQQQKIYNVSDTGTLDFFIDTTAIEPGVSIQPFGMSVKSNGELVTVEQTNELVYTITGKLPVSMENLLANGLIQLHLDQVNIYVQD